MENSPSPTEEEWREPDSDGPNTYRISVIVLAQLGLLPSNRRKIRLNPGININNNRCRNVSSIMNDNNASIIRGHLQSHLCPSIRRMMFGGLCLSGFRLGRCWRITSELTTVRCRPTSSSRSTESAKCYLSSEDHRTVRSVVLGRLGEESASRC